MSKKLYLIIADENLFHPHYVLGLIKNLEKDYKIIGITFAKDKYKNGFLAFLRQQYALWGVGGLLFIIGNTLGRSLLDRLIPKNNFTTQGIARRYKIKIYETYNVNSEKHLTYLEKRKIDVIISSNGQIFKKSLLNLPRVACINRHTALLPKYGGVLPVFWAMLRGEKEFGVSIHYMVEKIDQGDIISQVKISFDNNSLFKNYILGFDKSIDATLRALDNIEKGKSVKKFSKAKSSYFSFPDYKTIKTFHKKNKAFVLSDIYQFYKYLLN